MCLSVYGPSAFHPELQEQNHSTFASIVGMAPHKYLAMNAAFIDSLPSQMRPLPILKSIERIW